MAEEAPKTVGTGPALGKDFGEHVMDVGKKEEALTLGRFKEGMAHKMPPLKLTHAYSTSADCGGAEGHHRLRQAVR